MVMARALKSKANLRCDFCHKIIPSNKVAYQVNEGEATGIYHGRICFGEAYKHYQELKKTV